MITAQKKLLLRTAVTVIETSLAVKPGEKFLTMTDSETHPIGHAFEGNV